MDFIFIITVKYGRQCIIVNTTITTIALASIIIGINEDLIIIKTKIIIIVIIITIKLKKTIHLVILNIIRESPQTRFLVFI